MIESLLIANRGEIARRIIRTARRLGVRTIAVHSELDADLPFVADADESVDIGAPQAYRNVEAVLDAARKTNAAAIHPGYGFLSENAGFARAVEDAGLIWVGPTADAIQQMGDKINARNLMSAAGVPVSPGTTAPLAGVDAAVDAATAIGYPVMVKAAAGGGGMGMAAAADETELRGQYAKITAFAERMFGDGSVLIERYFPGCGTSRCRSSAWPTAGSSRSASASARCSGATRRSPRRRRPRPCRRSCGPGCWAPRSWPVRPSATATRVPSNACWTPTPATSSSWR
ncbi:hypothetical protein Athai_63340 [Actinocatenispora thailandica]|uniref:biotin carboxylase n=1 Tax=Actinocatenispora thailandica TaxID=227318 RepID=A0A7R7DW93_9ACTN|nr:hypothetical protein Athai_63340 [Actinocatenispora thailandica]